MAQRKKTAARRAPDPAGRILEATLALAEEVGWENVRLRLVADRLGIGLAEVGALYRDLDAVADAWFGRARAALLAPVGAGFAALPARERLHVLMMRWFDTLAPHREVTAQMLAAKMWPVHVHHWVPMIFDLSRTILWLRDAAGLDEGGVRRQIEEIGLTKLFLATLCVWSRDDTEGQERTRRFLTRRLALADSLMAAAFRRPPPAEAEA